MAAASRIDKTSSAVRKRIESHSFDSEGGEEYEASAFGGFSDYFRRKKLKLQNLDADLRAAAGKPPIFKGVVAHVSGYTQPPLHVLHKQLVEHGAGFLQYLDGKTMATHIIAGALTPKKAVEFASYRIVKPAWVVDSIAAGKMLPWADYRVVDEGPRQRVIKFTEEGKLSSQAHTPQRGYKDQIQNSFYASQFKTSESPASRFASSPSKFAHLTPSRFTPSKLQPLEGIDDDDDDDGLPPLDEAQAMRPSSPDLPALPNSDEGVDLHMVDPMKIDKTDQEEREEESTKPTIEAPRSPPKKPMTSEDHNAWLLSDPRLRKSSTANPDFIQQYYAESRLHHLSTWKADLKSKMQRMAQEKGGPASKKIVKRRPGARRYILHVDFDSFFCAVSLKSAPEYVDKPAVVAHGTGTGSEIASCNYPARAFGVKNGMWMKRALELCPDLKVLPYDFPAYEEASKLFYEAILEVGGVVQSVSIDEALIDVTALVLQATGSIGVGVSEGSVWREQEKAEEIAANLRVQIKKKTGCDVSVGIGGNILLAKVALRKAKPAGQYQIKPEEVLDFLAQLNVGELPGVAYSIGGKLEEMGIKLVRDIRDTSKERLVSALGPKTGERLWEYARGIDRVEVGDQPVRKSVSAEVNWGIRFLNQPEAEEFVVNLCKELERRLLHESVKGKHLTMKIMRRSLDAPLDPAKHLGHGKCDTFNKSVFFGVATHSADTIAKEAVSILRSFKFSPGDLRGLGVQLQKLEPIKAASAAAPEGSQKRLNFGTTTPAAAAQKRKKQQKEGTAEYDDDISDFGSPPDKSSSVDRRAFKQREISADPINVDPLTPRKPKTPSVHPALALARANEADEKATTPLNLMGTQFIMPTNPDAAVLAELPQDIRSRLMAQQQHQKDRQRNDFPKREQQAPAAKEINIPPDIDPEVFHALPDDVKAEVLASYGQQAAPSPPPPVPRKEKPFQPATTKKSPSKRGRGGSGVLRRTRERQRDATAGRVQTNLLVTSTTGDGGEGEEELDPTFLAELPEDVRREVLEDHQRRRQQQQRARLGLGLHAPNRRLGRVPAAAAAAPVQATIAFPQRPARVSFTATSVTSLREVKDMLNAWHRETADEGPHSEDVDVFARYLGRIVVEERDMEKAKKLVKWLDWLIEENDQDSKGKQGWRDAVGVVKDAVQKALDERGLGPMAF